MFSENCLPDRSIRDVTRAIMANHWNWNYAEFCRRCRLRDDAYAQKQWQAFNDLHRAFYAIDEEILAVVGAAEATEPAPV